MPTTYTLDLAAPLVTALTERTGATTKQYLYGQGDSPMAVYTGTWKYLSGRDGLNSVRQETDAAGNVLTTRSFDPYGVPLDGNGGAPFGYTGEQTDATGLVFLRARYMQPGLGRFLSRDPWSGDELRPGSMNGWIYVVCNPINSVDPTGRRPEPNFGPNAYEYSCNCGWIDWSHAGPSDASKVIKAIKDVQLGPIAPGIHRTKYARVGGIETNETKLFMRGGVEGTIMVNTYLGLGQSGSYLYPVSLGVYKELNDLFEAYQGGNSPLGPARGLLDLFGPGSSFSEEDLMSDLIGFYIAVGKDRKDPDRDFGGNEDRLKNEMRKKCRVVGTDKEGVPQPDYQQKQQAIYEKNLIIVPPTASHGGYSTPGYSIPTFKKVHEWSSPQLHCDLADCQDEPQRMPDLFREYSPIPHSVGDFWWWDSASAYFQAGPLDIRGDYDVRELNR